MYEVTREDRISYTRVRATVKVGEISRKTLEVKLRWHIHAMKRDGASVERRVLDMEVQGRRRRPKVRWKNCTQDVREKTRFQRDR